MKGLDEVKVVKLVETTNLGTSAVNGNVDGKGFSDLTILLNLGTAAATNLLTTLKLQHGNTTSAFTDIAGAVGGTDANGGFQIPAGNTSAGEVMMFRVGLKGKKRYTNLSLVGTATARSVTALAILSRPGVAPVSAADAGVSIKLHV